MDVLDSIGEDPMEAYSRAMQFVKKQQAASARRGQMVEDDEDDSRSQNDGDHEFTGVNI